MLDQSLKIRVISKVAELTQLANVRYNKTLSPPPVFFNVHGIRGGYHKSGMVYYNPILLAENTEYFISTTVPHEVAHYVQWHVFPDTLQATVFHNRRIHGQEWKNIMRGFGVYPTRTHTYDTTNSRRRQFERFPVYCGCPVVQYHVTRKIVNRMNAGKQYTCKVCHRIVSLNKPLTISPEPVLS